MGTHLKNTTFTDYLFRFHSYDTVKGWAGALRHLRFCRAFGGHANDADAFKCSVQFKGEAGLREVCERLSIRLVPVPRAKLPGIAGKTSVVDEEDDSIDEFPHYRQPGHTKILGVRVFAWVNRNCMDFELCGADGDPYEVTQKDFQNAKRLDDQLQGLQLKFRDPPVDSHHCICPKYWPEFFSPDPA
jgi:hypothetical protein